MSIVFNRGLPPSQPQTHALVIGVGEYFHLPGGSKYQSEPAHNTFGLGQLSPPPLSAIAIANWLPNLSNPRAPLGTVDVLLSPGAFMDATGSRSQVDVPTMRNVARTFADWSKRCGSHADNVALFFFCGHGFEDEVTTLLPADFGDPSQANVAANMIDFSTTYICNLRESNARTQLYLLDACRETPNDLLRLRVQPTPLISTQKLQQPQRNAPIFQAANSGTKAFGEPGKPSYFTQSLLDCIQRFGARGQNAGRWEVSTNSLGVALQHYMRRLKVPSLPPFVCDVAGQSNFDTPIHILQGPAFVMTLIDCEPLAALAVAQLSVTGNGSATLQRGPSAEVWEIEISAGQYNVAAMFAGPPYQAKTCIQLMQPPHTPCTLEVGQ